MHYVIVVLKVLHMIQFFIFIVLLSWVRVTKRKYSNKKYPNHFICREILSVCCSYRDMKENASETQAHRVLDTTLCDNVCRWLTIGRWFSPGTSVSSTNKTERHDITEILSKVALNTIILNLKHIIVNVCLIITFSSDTWKMISAIAWLLYTHAWIRRIDFDNLFPKPKSIDSGIMSRGQHLFLSFRKHKSCWVSCCSHNPSPLVEYTRYSTWYKCIR